MNLPITAILVMARSWWAFMLRGLLAIVFGIVVLLFPGIGLVTLVLLFAFWMISDGLTELVRAWRTRGQRHWWMGLVEGVAGLVAGALAFVWPAITAAVLLFLVAAWAIFTGAMELIAAIRLRESITGEIWLGLAGLLSVAFGLILLIFPGLGLLSVLWLVATFAIIFGASLLLLGWRLRGLMQQAERQGEYAERGM